VLKVHAVRFETVTDDFAESVVADATKELVLGSSASEG
jgi:hypothetical protein